MKRKILIILVATIFLSVFFVESEIIKTDNEKNYEIEAIGEYTDSRFSKCKEEAICNFNLQVEAISSGNTHTIMATKDGRLYSFGWSRGLGILGNGVNEYSTIVPIPVQDGDGFRNDGTDPIISIDAGNNHSMFVTASGIVYGFGSNIYGELGSSGDKTALPRKVSSVVGGFQNDGSDKVVKVKAGYQHSIILTESGKVYTFGLNRNGQLGNSGITTGLNKNENPIKVSDAGGFINGGTDKAIDIATGFYHSIILTESGKIYTFGNNEKGELGNGDSGPDTLSNVPIAVSSVLGGFQNDGSDKVISAAGGNGHTIFSTKSGKVYVMGSNSFNKLGISGTPMQVTAALVSDGDGFINGGSDPVISVEAGYDHTIFLTQSGTVYAFGHSAKGQLGYQPLYDTGKSHKIDNNIAEEFENGGSDPVVKIEANWYISFVITSSGNLYGFGDNAYGQLGVGSTTNSLIPSNGLVYNFALNGKGITHSNEISNMNKYSSDVVIKDITYKTSVKLEFGETSQDITGKFINGEYTIGNTDNQEGFKVNFGEEKKFTVTIIPLVGHQLTYTFIIDKKPPTITEIIGSSGSSVCNVIDNKYYCNKDVGFTVVSDLSGIYSGEKKSDLGTEDITANIAAGLVNSFGGEILEKQKVIYTLIDGAGNIFTTDIILDNYIPRNELK